MNDSIHSSPDAFVSQILQARAPQSVLLVGNQDLPALNTHSQTNAVEITHHPIADNLQLQQLSSRYDLCLITPEFSQLPKQTATELLAGIRNRYCHHIYVFTQVGAGDQQTQWREGDFFGLGLKRIARFESDAISLHCFAYEIESYIKKRDWNNSKYWANPENFGKYWW